MKFWGPPYAWVSKLFCTKNKTYLFIPIFHGSSELTLYCKKKDSQFVPERREGVGARTQDPV